MSLSVRKNNITLGVMKMETETKLLTPSNPGNIIFEITYRCNLKCEMCYLKDNYLNKNNDELSLEEIERFLDSLSSKPNIILSGGEAFARSDILDIVAAVKRRGMKCIIFSNGTLLTEDRIRSLVDLGLDSISFSLDGPEKIFEEVTQINGSFSRLMKNIDLLIKIRNDKPQITLSCVLSKKNIENASFLLDFAQDPAIALVSFLHLHYVTFQDTIRNEKVMHHDGIFPGKPAVNRQQWGSDVDLAQKIISFKNLVQENPKVEFVPNLGNEEILSWYGEPENFPVQEYCFYPWVTSRIAPNGTVYICQNHVVEMGNLRKNTFDEIWNGSAYSKFRKSLKMRGMFPGCNRCCKTKTYTRQQFPDLDFPIVFP